jgi:hypothetical protein
LIGQYTREGVACGVIPNLDKCVVLLGVKEENELAGCIKQYTDIGIPVEQILVHPSNNGDPLKYGTRHLGVPIGSDEYIKQWLVVQLEKYEIEANSLMEVANPQNKWVFLQYCFARKPSFILRHILPSLTTTFCTGFDKLLKDVFESVINTKVTDVQWKQVTLPIKHGGFGIPPTSIVAQAAFNANVLETKAYLLLKVPGVITRLEPTDGVVSRFSQEHMDGMVSFKRNYQDQLSDADDKEEKWDNSISYFLDNLNLQYHFTSIATKTAKHEIFDTLNSPETAADHARFISVSKPYTGLWLLACPKSAPTTFSTAEFQMAARLRLGCEISNAPKKCNCKRKPVLDKLATHLLCCPLSGLIRRHDAIQSDILALAKSAGNQASVVCKDVLVLNTVGDNRRGDMILPQLGPGEKNVLGDFTITCPTASSYVEATRRDPESSIKRANDKKNTKYKDAAEALDIKFMPLALECYGAFSKDFLSLIHTLCEKRATIAGTSKNNITQYWFRRLSCTLQKGNARAISKRILEITQATATLHDECFDDLNDEEYNNMDTTTNFRLE